MPDRLQVPALDSIRNAQPGTMVCGRERDRSDADWRIGCFVREASTRIKTLGPVPETEWRAGVLVEERVLLMAILLGIGPKASTALYLSWVDHCADRAVLPGLARQSRIEVHFIGDGGTAERTLGIDNTFAEAASTALEAPTDLRPWPPYAFDRARETIERTHGGPQDLWAAFIV